uniref:Cytochrome c biogenesis FC n=1 Tax=Cocos nucifera TaxID=13894 RepID=A0A2Z2CEJ1_COCNU|nr:cytochrome c biogenesis FC [Cocos nucifera]AOX13000.1 cytochrome c biogenesis FC [Cocos nucifera]
MVQLQNFFFFITSMVVPRGTAAPVLLKWFVSRDVPTGAPSSNGTIIPIPIPEFLFLVYLHSRKFIRSMDRAKSGVLVRASRPILLPDIIGRSSSARNALFRFVPVFHFLLIESMGDLSYLESFCGLLCLQIFRTLFSLPRDRSAKRERARRRKGQTLRPNGNEQGRNDKMRCPGHPHIERRVEGFGPVAFPVPPSSSGACLGGVPPEIGLEALALPTSRLLMAVGHDYMRQKLVPRTVRRPSPTPAIMVRLRSTNTNKIEFTQRLPLGPELHMGKERCCLRGLDHLHGPTSHSICGNLMIYKSSPTSDRFMFEHDESLRADLLPINFPPSYENGKLEHFLHRWMKNHEHKNFWFTMFPEKRYFFSIRERTSTTEVAIHTNPFTDLYAPIGTGSSRTGGWYTTIMKLPFIFSIRIGFLLASSGGSRSLLRQLQKDKLHWNRESSVPFIIA